MDVATRPRLIGPDVVRGIALIGVVTMNYHGYLILDGGTVGRSAVNHFFDPWDGPLSTRFAATFVTIAGVGITLFSNRARLAGDAVLRRETRWVLIRRGLLLYAFGYLFDWIWPGTILFFYGAYFVVGAFLFALRTRWVVLVGVASAVVAAAVQWWAFERHRDGHRTEWLLRGWYSPGRYDSPRRLLFDTFLTGTHPLLPWLAFLCAGIVLGRHLPQLATARGLLIGCGTAAVALTYLVKWSFSTTPLRALMLYTTPASRSLNYTVCTLGSSVAAVCILDWLANRTARWGFTQALGAIGRSTLTLYVLHAVVFNAIVHWFGWVRPTGLDTSLPLALGYWLVAGSLAVVWQRNRGMAPAERLYRRFGGVAEVPATAPR